MISLGDIFDFIIYMFSSDSPLWGKILMVIVFFFTIVLYIYKNTILTYIKDLFKKKKVNRTYMKNHGIFVYIDEILRVKINNHNFKGKYKNQLYKDFISIPLRLLKKHLLHFSEKINLYDIPRDELNSLIMNFIFDYNEDVMIHMKAEFGDELLILLDREEWDYIITDYISDTIKECISNQNDYPTNDVAIAIVLTLISFSLKRFFELTTKKYQNINGVLDELHIS